MLAKSSVTTLQIYCNSASTIISGNEIENVSYETHSLDSLQFHY